MAEFLDTSQYGDEEEEGVPLLSLPDGTIDPDETELKVLAESENVMDQPLPSTKPLPQGKEYHLFMSYSSEDRIEANTILEQLEERFQLKCLYYERDFHIGRTIDENITEGMQKSMKALLLLSPFYLQSHNCVTEAREVCKMSFTDVENLNVIPVVLTPLQRGMPPFLNSYVYIDAQKELDVAGKIYKAFNQPGYLDPLQIDKSALSCNGSLLFRKVARKTKYVEHGLSYRFLPIEPHEEAKICQHGLDPTECKNQYDTIIGELNKTYLFRNYPVFSSLKWRCLLLCLLFVALSFIWVASFLLSGTNGSILKDEGYFMSNLTLGIPLTCLPFMCGFPFIYGCRRRLSANINSFVLQHNLRFYKRSKCLVYFDQPTLTQPTLYIYRYDLTECEEYLLSLLGKHRHGDPGNNQEILENLIAAQLKELQMSKGLINWTHLRETAINRHRTSNNRACICEMLEDHVNKTYGSSIIEV